MATSPDGHRHVFTAGGGEDPDLWIADAVRGTRSRLTFTTGNELYPSWSPDGRDIVYQAQVGGAAAGGRVTRLVRVAADGTGRADTLANGLTAAYTPDGQSIVFAQVHDGQWDLAWMPLADRTVRRFAEGPGDQYAPRVSPDGRLVAYVSTESGQFEVFLRRFPGGEGRWQVSTGGGHYPRWNRKGDRLYYLINDDIMEVDVTSGASPVLGNPRRLFTRPAIGLSLPPRWPAAYDLSDDGNRFTFLRDPSRVARKTSVMVVDNWMAEFSAKK
jgi:serine/threonine-protein kinase